MFLLELMRKEELKWSKSWFVLALCRFSLGICIYSFLSSLIFKSYYYVTRTNMYQIPVKSGKFSEYYLWLLS
jgi:hypothetical protein